MTSEKFSTFLDNLKTKPKAIIFDWDNTLVDTWPLIHGAIDKTMTAMGREPWGMKKVRDTVHKSMRESFPEIFGDKWEEAGEIYKNTYRSTHLNIQLLEGSLELLQELHQMGILLFVVSNKMGATLRKEVEQLGLNEIFFAVIGSLDAKYDKPDKAPVELALIGSDLDPKKDEIWFVGDTIADIDCAKNSGCRPILFSAIPGEISRTVDEKMISGEERLPLYFEHEELIKKIKSF